MSRCDATRDGFGCLYSTHGSSGHLFPDDEGADSYRLGKLQSAVDLFLDGRVDREFLARARAETDAEGR